MCNMNVVLVEPRCAKTETSALLTLATVMICASLSIVSSHSFASSVEGIAAFNGGRFDTALKTLRPLADADDSVAKCYVARIFNAASGGVRRDSALTKQYAESALRGLNTKASEGDAAAQACLSVLRSSTAYLSEPNQRISLQLAKQAAEQGNADGQRLLADIYQRGIGVTRDYAQANLWLEKASRGGSIHAKRALLVALRNGWGVEKDALSAALQFKSLADSGDAFAQREYAVTLRLGTGVPQNYAGAREWYERAAAQFDAWAQNDLGFLYENGYGVTSNAVLASEWYQRSADQGHSMAQVNLGRLYLSGRGVFKNEVKGVEYIRASANQYNARGQYFLGLSFERGVGVTADAVQALGLYRKSAAQSDPDAAKAIKRLTGKAHDTVVNIEQIVESIGEN